MKQLLLPKKIIKIENAKNEKALFSKKPLQVVLRSDENWVGQITEINGKGSIVLDFGKEMHGGIRIITGAFIDKNFTSVRIRFGESLSEAYSDIGDKGATNDHSQRDFNAVLSAYGDVCFGQTGFRFVRIDILEEITVRIQNIFCVNEILNKKVFYRYNGKDKLVKKIFDTAKRTVDLCASTDYVWDGVKRDRLVWIGDMHPEMLALTTMYGRFDSVERSLEFVKDNTPDNLWMNGIASYSMWWMIIVADYYFMTGCKDFALNQIDYFNMLISRFNDSIDAEGNMKYSWFFVDWSTCDSPDMEAGVRAINILALNKAIEMFDSLGVDTANAKSVVEKLKLKPIIVKQMKQVIGLKYLALGEITDDEYALLIKGGANGLSTFMSYYILTAIASRDALKAVEIMKEYYGAMLSIGATTFFEDFDMEWLKCGSRIDKLPKKGKKDIHGDYGKHCYGGFRHSLCHGWSSGVIKFIYDYKDEM